jgi:hypothetical protein
VRPIVDNHGWDHESGIEGFSVDKAFMLRKKIPANVSGQITKDKKDANLTLETEASMKHSDKLVTTSGLDIQTVGKQLAYTVRSETRWKNKSNNKTTGGLSASLIGGTMAFGAKLEDRCDALSSLLRAALGFSRHPTGGRSGRAPSSWSAAARSPQRATLRTVRVVAAAVQACRALIPRLPAGGNCEGIMRKQSDETGTTSTTVGASFMNWRGDVALGGNAQTQFNVGKDTQLTARANLNRSACALADSSGAR